MKLKLIAFFIFLVMNLILAPVKANGFFGLGYSELEALSASENVAFRLADSSLNQDSRKVEIYAKVRTRNLITEFPAYFGVHLYKLTEGEKNYIEKIGLTITRKRHANSFRVKFAFDYYPSSNSELFYFDVVDATGTVVATYQTSINFVDELITTAPSGDGLTSYDCTPGDGPCLLEYIFGNINFYSNLEQRLQTKIIKEANKPYRIITPLLRRRATLGRVEPTRLIIDGNNGNNNNNGGGDNDSSANSLILGSSALDTTPVTGKLEFDGTGLYFTTNSGREKVFLGNPPSSGGSSGPISIPSSPTFTGTTTAAGDLIVNEALSFDGIVTNAAAPTTNIDWHAGNRQSVVLDQASILTFAAPPGVSHLTLMLIQDATGGRTVTWPASVRWPNSSAPSLTTSPNQIDIITCFYTGSLYYCQAGLNFAP
jgi:hypothetical protein